MHPGSRHGASAARYGASIAIAAMLASASPLAGAQTPNPPETTDPVRLGIMQGFPPAPDKRVTKANAFQLPNLRWAFRHARETSPTAGITRAASPHALPAAPVARLDDVTFDLEGQQVKLSSYLHDTYTDGFIVLHKGQVIYERYFDSFGPRQLHIWASMTKSITGLLAAMLIDEGKLDPNAKLASYVPELAGNPFGEATIQKNLDMEVAVSYPASLPPDLGLFGAVGLIARRDGAPDNIYDFLKAAQVPQPAAGTNVWYYQNGSPEALAWALRRITGQSWSELVAQRIWSRFAEDDAYIQVDQLGTEMASGGMNSTLRDAARFAEAIRKASSGENPGAIAGKAVRLALKPNDNQALFATGNLAAGRANYAYRDYWYQVNDGDGSIEASGRFGQKIYINPKKALTIVKFSSSPDTAPRPTSANATSAGSTQRRPAESPAAFANAVKALYAAIPH
ncbi:serine hydrolase domain-containing protein [Cupriavidus basilensis]|uniref:serine hydrolase domain-containing protein n=1 Tax=Cupriavidus basilensis TaxID=68895 RepID=UPI00284EE704|nr:serine hydrolase [Cupriavidus basilensis]MDR3381198.1 serine hydrolase [Cupriavidus basilensis]